MPQPTWRSVLRELIEDPAEKNRIAKEMHIAPVTLTRWTTSEVAPRLYFLAPLVQAVPEKDRMRLRTLIEQEYPGFSEEVALPVRPASEVALQSVSPQATTLQTRTEELQTLSAVPDAPPQDLYTHVLTVCAATRAHERFWQLCSLILPHALRQLNGQRVGMFLSVACCLPCPTYNEIHSLREAISIGTPPWNSDLQEKQFLLGAESLAGYVVSSRHRVVIQNTQRDQSFLPGIPRDKEQSIAIFPILQADAVAGALICICAQANYFCQHLQLLLQHYANLLTLTFSPEQFYPPQQIALRFIPSIEVQQEYFTHFRTRIAQKVMQAAKDGQQISSFEAEQMVRQQLAEELASLLLH